MAKSSIDKLNKLFSDNKRYDVIFNYIKSQHDKKAMYSYVLKKIELYFKDNYSIIFINNIIKLLYKMFNDDSFNLNLLTKGELYILSKIYKMYNDYIEQSKIEVDESIKANTIEISSKVNEKYDINNKPCYKLYFKLEQLDQTIEELNDRLANLLKKYRKKSTIVGASSIDENAIISELSLIFESLNKNLIRIEHEALKITIDSEFMEYLENVINKLNIAQGEYKTLTNAIKEYQENIAKKESEEELNKEFKKIILEKLCSSSCTLDELREHLKNHKIFMSNDELYKRLNDLNNKVNIVDRNHLSQPSYYKVCEPLFETLKTFKLYIPDYKKELDLMFISDLHIGNVSDDIYERLYNMYEYAINNNINTIINLGDICSLSNFDIETKQALLEAEGLMEEIILKYPKDHSINNLLMGGNHDKSLFAGGINPIRRICSERYDFKNLGYDNTILDIGTTSTSNYFALHHPNQRVSDNETVLKEIADIKKLTKPFYTESNLTQDNNLMDFYGHFHKSLLDTANGICVVPSLSKDRYMNGAWHIKLYFDKDMKIDYMVLIPLINIDKRLISSQSIVYQKKLK